jgi:hypothetical protein
MVLKSPILLIAVVASPHGFADDGVVLAPFRNVETVEISRARSLEERQQNVDRHADTLRRIRSRRDQPLARFEAFENGITAIVALNQLLDDAVFVAGSRGQITVANDLLIDQLKWMRKLGVNDLGSWFAVQVCFDSFLSGLSTILPSLGESQLVQLQKELANINMQAMLEQISAPPLASVKAPPIPLAEVLGELKTKGNLKSSEVVTMTSVARALKRTAMRRNLASDTVQIHLYRHRRQTVLSDLKTMLGREPIEPTSGKPIGLVSLPANQFSLFVETDDLGKVTLFD